MKRRGTSTTIDDFFNRQATKDPISSSSLNNSQGKLLNIMRVPAERKMRRIVNDSLSHEAVIPEERFEAIWSELSSGIASLFERGAVSINFAKLYRSVEYFCRYKDCMTMYSRLQPELNQIVDRLCECFNESLEIGDLAAIVVTFQDNLTNFRNLFSYFDRSYIYANKIDGFISLAEIVYSMIRDRFKQSSSLVSCFLPQIRIEVSSIRCGQSNGSALAPVLKFMDDIGIYEALVQPMLMELTQDFFEQVSHDMDLEHFLEWYGIAIEKEGELHCCGVKEATIELIMCLVRKICLIDNVDVLFGDAFGEFIAKKDITNIRTIFKYFDNDDTRYLFNENFGRYFMERIKCVVLEKDADAIINEYIDAQSLCRILFGDDSPMVAVVKRAVNEGLAHEPMLVAQLLARYFNHGKKMYSMDDPSLELLDMSHDKEAFEATYVGLLKERILTWNPIDIDRERLIVNILKKTGAREIFERLERMIGDLGDNTRSLKYSTETFDAMILSSAVFASDTVDNVNFPPDVQYNMRAAAEEFIGGRSHIDIMWSSTLSTVTVQVCGTECVMSGDQYLIIMAVNDGSTTVDEISATTGINTECVQKNLAILQKKRVGRIISCQNDTYSINNRIKFKSPSPIIFPRVTSVVPGREHEQSIESNNEEILSNRIMCAIIQKMKVFHQMSLSELFAAVQKTIGASLATPRFLAELKKLEDKNFVEKIGDRSYRYI